MVRPNRRKPIEEVYGTKLEPAHATGRSQTLSQPGITKTSSLRCSSSRQTEQRTQRSYMTANDYYITTNLPLNATNMRATANNLVTHPSVTSNIPPYGSLSNRRGKPSARLAMPAQHQHQHQLQQQQQQQQTSQKARFVSGDGKSHTHMQHPHPHPHPHGQKQMTQRSNYTQHIDIDPTMVEISEKDIMSAGNLRRATPLQHQLHQQQQQMHTLTSSRPGVHYSQQHQKQQQQQQLQYQQLQQQQQQQQHKSQSKHHSQRGGGMPQQHEMPVVTEEEDKDEDPEEFFELIRQTVKTAVGTTFCDVVTRNFRDLSSKIDRFSNELKVTNESLGKLQTEVMSKVTHFGEENSRHFRYLCMKSEYDKMFYQHQSLMSGKTPAMPTVANPMPISTRVAKQPAAAFSQKSVKQQLVVSGAKMAQGDNTKKVSKESMKAHNLCGCHNTLKQQTPQLQQQQQQQQQQLAGLQLKKNDLLQASVSDQSVNNVNTSEKVLDVLGQLSRFCTQMQLSDLKDDERKHNSLTGVNAVSSGGKINPNIAVPTEEAELDTPIDSMDEIEIENFEYTSDEMSSYSDESDMKFTGGMTVRAPLVTSRPKTGAGQLSHKGAGDGQ